MNRPIRLTVSALLAFGCSEGEGGKKAAAAVRGSGAPDELPRMTNAEPPFRYPTSLYERKVQANVTLRLFIDEHGVVRPDSTRVIETSGHAALDSSAVDGARLLAFVPAKRRGEAVAVSVLFPVLFRHPEAAPLPGDTAFRGVRPDTVKRADTSVKADTGATSDSTSRRSAAPRTP